LAHSYSKCSQPSSRKRLRLLGDMATPSVVWPWPWVLYTFILFSSFLCHDSFFQLERAFELIKQGLVTLDDEDKIDKKKTSLPQFNDKLWGSKVRKWVMSTQKLDVKEHWPNILHNAASRVADFNVDEDGDEDDGDEDPRAMIVICK